MKYLKTIGLAAVGAMALTALVASSALATTGEIGGVAKTESLTVSSSLKTETVAALSRTDGSLANECAEASGHGFTESPYTGTTVGGSIGTGSVGECTRPVTIHNVGTIRVSHISGTTNGTVESSGDEITVGSPFGTLNCKTGAGVDMGVLTGVSSGHATVDVNAVLNCGFLVPSAAIKGTMTITSPTGAGVSA